MTPWALPVVLALLVGTTACGGTGDAGAVEVQTGLGVMDCPADEWDYRSWEIAATAEGSATADGALALLSPELGRPSGSPEVESVTTDRVVYLFRDSSGHRLGRAVAILLPNGWFVETTERCSI
jgi:hypothetical protein